MHNRTEEWQAVAERFSGLALKLKLHFEQAAGESTDEVDHTFQALGEAVEGAFGGLRAAIRDRAVQQDLKDAAAALRDVLFNTFSELTSESDEKSGRRPST